MDKSLKIKSKNKESLKALFTTKKEIISDDDSNLFYNEDNNESIKYNMDNVESEKEYYDELNDSLRKSTKWTDGSDKKLRNLVEEHGTKNWKFIASQLKNKTPVQCLHRWNKILKPGLVKGPWTIEEDRKLLEWVNINGPVKWTSCSEFISGRSGKQCRERWFNTLNPNVKKGGWTPEEDFLIFKYFMENGSKWSLIASKFPGRTENSVKNRFYSTLRRISLDKKKVLYNEKKNLESSSNQTNNNNIFINNVPNSNFIGNSENNPLNFSCNTCNINNPSSNLEELMKYFNHAFAEKTKIFLQYKKNEGEIINNLNINFDDPKELAKIDIRSLHVNEEILNDFNLLKNKNRKSSSKKDLKFLPVINNYNNVSNNDSKNFINLNNNFTSISNIANFISPENMNEENNKIFNQNFVSNNHLELMENLNIKSQLLNKKRLREEKEISAKPNQINNTFNINVNINNSNFDESIKIKPKKNRLNTNNDNKLTERNKKIRTKKFQKLEEIEELIENFNETTSKSNSQEHSNNHENDSKENFKRKKIPKFRIKAKNREEREISSEILDPQISQQENSNEINIQDNLNNEKDFVFKKPEICSNEEITKLSMNLIGKNNINQLSRKSISENYLYLENEKTKKTKCNQSNDKEEIFKFDALNDLYDQLNHLEDILLTTKKQLFNLDKFFYKENSDDKLNNNQNINETTIYSNLPNNLENINVNICELNNKINTMKNDNENIKTNQTRFITETASCISKTKKTSKNIQDKNNDFANKELETLTFTDIKDKELSNNNMNMINNNIINANLISNNENVFNLANLEKNPLIFQDDLPFMNIINNINTMKTANINSINNNNNNNNNVNMNNLFHSNILFNHFEGQLHEEQGYQYMENMFHL